MGADAEESKVVDALRDNMGAIYLRLRQLTYATHSDVLLIPLLVSASDAKPVDHDLPNFFQVGGQELYEHWHESMRMAVHTQTVSLPRCPRPTSKDFLRVKKLM
jgi:hypothetical protein